MVPQVDVEVIVSEPQDRYTVDFQGTWGIQPGPNGSPVLTSIVPGRCSDETTRGVMCSWIFTSYLDKYIINLQGTWGIQSGPNGSTVLTPIVPGQCNDVCHLRDDGLLCVCRL